MWFASSEQTTSDFQTAASEPNESFDELAFYVHSSVLLASRSLLGQFWFSMVLNSRPGTFGGDSMVTVGSLLDGLVLARILLQALTEQTEPTDLNPTDTNPCRP